MPLLPQGFDTVSLGIDRLVPVCTPALLDRGESVSIPVIAYPSDVFLGRIFQQHIAPRLPTSTVLAPKAETALTLAACEYALGGIGATLRIWFTRAIIAHCYDPAGGSIACPKRQDLADAQNPSGFPRRIIVRSTPAARLYQADHASRTVRMLGSPAMCPRPQAPQVPQPIPRPRHLRAAKQRCCPTASCV